MSRDLSGKTYWLIGASEGLGQALAGELDAAGAKLILSARSEDALTKLAGTLSGAPRVITIDVTDQASVDAAVKEAGQIDGLVFLAGAYWPMGSKDWDAEKAATMGDVNFTGALRVFGRVVPDMVARDAGHIVMTSSLTAYRGLPGSIGYTASKAGTLSLAQCMHCDLHKTGVDVQVVLPGFIKTRLTDKNDFKMPFIMDPGPAAQKIRKHMESDRFALNFPWMFSWVFRLARFLPDGLYVKTFGSKG